MNHGTEQEYEGPHDYGVVWFLPCLFQIPMTRLTAARRIGVCVSILTAVLSLTVVAQRSALNFGILDDATDSPGLRLQQQLLQSSMDPEITALEGPLDAEEYILGPGDHFNVSVGGLLPLREPVFVSASGNLVLPEAGVIPAAGRTLAVVQSEALEALQQRYVNVPVSISLLRTRTFYVHISGAVPEPGRYLMLPISRVDNAVSFAYRARSLYCPNAGAEDSICLPTSGTAERPELQEGFRPSLRNVRVTHRDGTTQTFDLMRYYTTGDTESNPYLQDGDHITVPAFHSERDAARVSGEIPYPGQYDVRPEETVLDILSIAAGHSNLEDIGEVRITRGDPGGEVISVHMSEMLQGNTEPPRIRKGDHINVLSEEVAQAAIYGRVQYPGTYRIEDGKTTLLDLVGLAGGLKDDASLGAAFMERRNSLNYREFGHTNNLDFFSRTYALSFAAHSANRVVANIEAILTGRQQDMVLYDGDRLVFPRNEGTVVVIGNVPRPGTVGFVEGQTAEYYINLVGGPGPGARTVYVFEDGTGEFRVGKSSIVRSGDSIFVDRKDNAETPDMAQLLLTKQQQRIQLTQVIITGVTAITSIITAYAAISR